MVFAKKRKSSKQARKKEFMNNKFNSKPFGHSSFSSSNQSKLISVNPTFGIENSLKMSENQNENINNMKKRVDTPILQSKTKSIYKKENEGNCKFKKEFIFSKK